MNVEELLKLDEEYVKDKIVSFIKCYLSSQGISDAVIGLSGGVDSSLTCFLLVEALGKEHVHAVLMPSQTTNPRDMDDAMKVAEMLGVDVEEFKIAPMVKAFKKVLKVKDKIALGNIMARIRMVILYNEARRKKALVVGTGNRTEILVGYFTKYGDGGVDILPIGCLYKTQVRQMARYLGVPEGIIKKPPSPGFWAGHTDEGELGMKYELLDQILLCIVDLRYSKEQTASLLKIPVEKVEHVLKLLKKNEHKRKLPP
ncbi:MAG: NAD+ synthase, partial [Candidatus Asgardarchaeia archaeon]